MRSLIALLALPLAAIAGTHPLEAASGTTCLCRSTDAKRFEERTLRHHRWACDFKLGYAKAPDETSDGPSRPSDQTCNSEEIIQFRVWLCIENGCTYPHAQQAKAPNTGLRRIEPMKGERRP